MNCTIFSIVLTFFTLSFSLLLLPMDPPEKKPTNQEWKNLTKHEAFQQLQITTGTLFHFPMQVLERHFPEAPPSLKNVLRETNKALNVLFSRQIPQDFMFCPQLNASESDKFSLMVEIFYRNNNQLPEFCPHNFKNSFCSILGYPKRKIAFNYSDESCPKLELLTTESLANHLTQTHIDDIHPMVIPFLTRNMEIITYHCKNTLVNLIEKRDKLDGSSIELLVSFFVQHDDVNSLELLCEQEVYKKCRKNSFASDVLQMAFFCASEKVMPILFQLYGSAHSEKISSCSLPEEQDRLAIYFNKKPLMKQRLATLIKAHHPELSEKHKNNIDRYHACLRQIWSDKELQKFNPAVLTVENEKIQKPVKKENKRKKNKFFFW